MITEAAFVGCEHLPEEMRGRMDQPWHFIGEVRPGHQYVNAHCGSCSALDVSFRHRSPKQVGIVIVDLTGHLFITDDMIEVMVYFGVCRRLRGGCRSPWRLSGWLCFGSRSLSRDGKRISEIRSVSVCVVVDWCRYRVYSLGMTGTTLTHGNETMTTAHENAAGKYFWTRHQVTKCYQVIEQRFAGSSEVKYLLSTGKNIKASFSELCDAVAEATRRQAWIDAK